MNHLSRWGQSTALGSACMAALLLLSACGTVPATSSGNTGETAVYVRHPHVAQLAAATATPARDADSLLSRNLIYFDFDSNEIRPADQVLVQTHAHYMMTHPGARLRLEGHADERGGTEYNLALGQRRADGVRRLMVRSGVPELVLEAVSLGEEMPVDPGHDESAWALNRRVELRYLAR